MRSSRRQLRTVLDDLFEYALRTVSADDVIRFLGQKIQPWKAEAANRRYLDARAAAQPVRHTIADLDTLCTGRVVNANRCPMLNPVAAPEHRIIQAVLAGEHAIHGFRNPDLQARLDSSPALSPLDADPGPVPVPLGHASGYWAHGRIRGERRERNP